MAGKETDAMLSSFMEEEAPTVETTTSKVSAAVTEEDEEPEGEPQMVDPSTVETGGFSDAPMFEVSLRDEDIIVIDKGMETEKVISNKEFIIESVDIQADKLKRMVAAGEEMTKSRDKQSQWHATKVVLKYKDSDYASYIPNVKWFAEKGSANRFRPSIQLITDEKKLKDKFVSEISKLYFRYCKAYGLQVGRVSQAEFVNGLVGKKVILRQWYGEGAQYEASRRLDIHKFVV